MGRRPINDNEYTPVTPSSPNRAASVNERYPMPARSVFQVSTNDGANFKRFFNTVESTRPTARADTENQLNRRPIR